MARPKKPTYEYVEKLGLYRKRIKDADGKYVAIYGKTEDELTEKIELAKREIEDTLTAKENPTFSDFADRWVELNTASVSRQTRADYCYIIDKQMKPYIGARRMKDIAPEDIKAAMLSLKNMSASVHNKALMLYKKIFEEAVENDLIRKSPCRGLKRGGIKAEEKTALTNEQVTVLINAVKGTIAYPFVMVGLYAGLRREEILGLKWDCVFLDKEAPHITVKRALRWENNQPIVEERLKSAAAKRNIPIPPQLVECLEEVKQTSKSDYIISNSTGGPRSQTQFKNLWAVLTARSVGTRSYTTKDANGEKVKVIVKQCKGEKCKRHNFCYTIDFPVTPHMLRHTYISNLILAGTDIKTVQYLAGHSTVEMTLDIYTHLTANKPSDLIDKVNKAFEVKSEVK